MFFLGFQRSYLTFYRMSNGAFQESIIAKIRKGARYGQEGCFWQTSRCVLGPAHVAPWRSTTFGCEFEPAIKGIKQSP